MLKKVVHAFFSVALLLAAALVLAGCSGTGLPVTPEVFSLAASSARVAINGQAAAGRIPVPEQGARMRLSVKFEGSPGASIAGAYCDYSHHGASAGQMGGMMSDHGQRFRMYDDGTHGDDIPGDGTYCLERTVEDMMRSMGMAMQSMHESAGDHSAGFYCTDSQGRESNRATVHFEIRG